MLPNKSHLAIIVKELERFESRKDEGYNFNNFFNRCRAIFPPKVQLELFEKLDGFKTKFYIGSIRAEAIIKSHRIDGRGGVPILRLTYPDGCKERKPFPVGEAEGYLRDIVVWCRKQVIRIVKDQQISFDEMSSLDLKESK